MTRTEKVAAINRNLAEIRSRVSRIQAEAFALEQQLRDVDLAVAALAAEDGAP